MKIWTMGLAGLLCMGVLLSPRWITREVVAAERKELRSSFDDALQLRVLREGEILELSLGEYLTGVVSKEMPPTFHEEENYK